MKYLRQCIKRILKESLEEESVLESLLKSGDVSMIHQAIDLADNMGMSLLDLPWNVVKLKGATHSLSPESIQFDFDLAGLVIEQVESNRIDIGSSGEWYDKMKSNYETMKELKGKDLKYSDNRFHERVFARTGLQNSALKLLRWLST